MKKSNVLKKSVLFLFGILLFISVFNNNVFSQGEFNNETNIDSANLSEECIHLFVDFECPQCQKALNFIEDELPNANLNVYDVSVDENKELYNVFKEKYGLVTAGYPVAFLGDTYLLGFSEIEKNIEKELSRCIEEGCECPIESVSYTPGIPGGDDYKGEELESIKLPILGEINAGEMPLVLFTMMIAFIDGFNPCSLWVLTFLLGIVLYTGSRKKITLVGLTFLSVTALVYGLFILGVINVFSYIGYTFWIKVIVGLLAFIFAVVNIKDYFLYKKGISFTISDKYKPKLFKKMRNIMDPHKSMASMLIATAVMALGVTLIELPCTSGFPMIWSGFMADQGIVGGSFISLLVVYIFIYLILELVIFFSAVFTLKASKFQKKHGRILKLIGGVLMLALAWALIFKDELMRSVSGSVYVFGIAFFISFIIMFIHRKVLPKYNIYIGTEFKKSKDGKKDGDDLKKAKNKGDEDE